MKTTTLIKALSVGGCLIIAATAGNAQEREIAGRPLAFTTPVGAAEINVAKIEPYRAVWTTPNGLIEERMVANGDVFRHVQTWYAADEEMTLDNRASVETRRISRRDLQPLSWRRDAIRLDETSEFRLVQVEASASGFAGEAVAPDGSISEFSAALPMPMYDGWIFGLTLAALPLEEGYTATAPAVAHVFRTGYLLNIRVIGREVVSTASGDVDTWVVNSEWVDLANGDVYEGGRDGSGGAYYMAVEPGDGVPYVVQYINDGTTIAWDGVRRSL